MKNEFEEKLYNWSNKAATYCRKVIEDPNNEIDLFFYAFQSPPRNNPDLLIIGLNPHENGSYKDGCSAWEIQDMTAETMMQENQFWFKKEGIKDHPGHETWPIWKKLGKLFCDDLLQPVLDESVYMNLIYFNTNNLNEFIKKRGSNIVIQECEKLTKEVVLEVIRPKCILCLSIPKCFDYIEGAGKQLLIGGRRKRLLIKKMFGDIPVYGIPHVSGSRISNNEFDEIREILRHELFS